MAKNVALSNKAYSVLSKLKKPRESFSDVVVRLVEGEEKPDITKFFGIWKGDNKIDKIYKEILEERHRSRIREVKF